MNNTTRLVQTWNKVKTQSQTLTVPITNRLEINSTLPGYGKGYCDQAHPPRKPMLPAKAKSAPLILHVDDDVDLVDALSCRLASFGYRTASALDGVSGVEAASRQSVSAVILDYDMPNGRGDVVIKKLRANEKTKDIPIIVLTAVEQKDLARKLLSQGADVFMTKQSKFTTLQVVLKKLLEGDDSE